MDNKQLGLFIEKIRKERDISEKALCEGICAQSFLASVESGEKTANSLMMDILLQRLGVSEDGYDKFLSQIEYEKVKRRYCIINFIESNEIKKAEEELKLYRNSVDTKNKFHMQFILCMESRFLVLDKKDYKSAYRKLKQAIKLTVPRLDDVKLADLILSFFELFLIVEYYKIEEMVFTDALSQQKYEDVLNYVETNVCDELIRAKIYTKTVCLTCKYWFLKKEYKKILNYCNKGLEYLQNSGKLYFMSHILENKKMALKLLMVEYNENIDLLEEKICEFKEIKKDYKTTLEWESMINHMFIEYNVVYELYEWYPYYTKGIYFIGNVIKKRRTMLNMSQLKLSDGICSAVTMSRIENGVTVPQPNIARQLLKKLNLSGDIYSSNIISEDYDIHKQCHELENLMLLKGYEDAKILLKKLESGLDMSNLINRQYFKHKQIIIYESLKIISQQDALKLFKEAFHITIPQNCNFKMPHVYFSKKEIIILNNIAITLKNLNNKNEALRIYELLDDYYNDMNFNIKNNIATYELAMSNYESLLGNMGEYDKSNIIIEKTVHESLKYRRGRFIPGFLYSKAWNVKDYIKKKEKREMQLSEKDLYKKELKKSHIMSCIMQDKVAENFINKVIEDS